MKKKLSNLFPAIGLGLALAVAAPAVILPEGMVCAAAYSMSNPCRVVVQSGYLALRTAKAFDTRNEIGRLNNGEVVYVQSYESGGYAWVYAPSLGMQGYVNSSYLVPMASQSVQQSPGYSTSTPRIAWVDSGYLALRSAKAFDRSNEIGQIHAGETVYVQSYESGGYAWVYAPTLGKFGYVNSSYLR